jgi:hypothetical protein
LLQVMQARDATGSGMVAKADFCVAIQRAYSATTGSQANALFDYFDKSGRGASVRYQFVLAELATRIDGSSKLPPAMAFLRTAEQGQACENNDRGDRGKQELQLRKIKAKVTPPRPVWVGCRALHLALPLTEPPHPCAPCTCACIVRSRRR